MAPALRRRRAMSRSFIWSATFWYSSIVDILAKSATTALVSMTLPQLSLMSWSFWLILSRFLATTQILKPCLAKSLQYCSPMPSEPPVTTAQESLPLEYFRYRWLAGWHLPLQQWRLRKERSLNRTLKTLTSPRNTDRYIRMSRANDRPRICDSGSV